MKRSATWLSLVSSLLLLSSLGQSAHADQAWYPDTMFVQQGQSARSNATTLGATWSLRKGDRLWGGITGVYVEASIARWEINTPSSENSVSGVSQIGFTPVARWAFSGESGLFAEAGIGVNLIGPTYRAGRKQFSTAFNFGDHVGIGFSPLKGHELALRFQHFSNAGVKQPNPGEDFIQLRWAAAMK